MEWFAPHRRNFSTMYRVIWWKLITLEEKQDKTPAERQEIITCRAQLDNLWTKMSEAQKHDLDPTRELRKDHGGRWTKADILVCPNCGWIHYVTKGSSGAPRCSACMMDVAL